MAAIGNKDRRATKSPVSSVVISSGLLRAFPSFFLTLQLGSSCSQVSLAIILIILIFYPPETQDSRKARFGSLGDHFLRGASHSNIKRVTSNMWLYSRIRQQTCRGRWTLILQQESSMMWWMHASARETQHTIGVTPRSCCSACAILPHDMTVSSKHLLSNRTLGRKVVAGRGYCASRSGRVRTNCVTISTILIRMNVTGYTDA
ncbi:hypothetical protein F4780DRAFT_211094 [Xylariomycetidae sp. FL0641]|nr:hypothetical protein F4780DRAFT_211094 [Xylariomycetidae sp. FL0641]